MARKNVTRKDAEKVLAALKKQHPDETYPPQIVENWNWTGRPTRWAIVWEEGPYEWAYTFPFGGLNEEATALAQEFIPGAVIEDPVVEIPDHLFTEAITSWAIGIYLA